MAVETWEDKIMNNGQEEIYGVPLGGTEMVDFMALSLSPAEYRPTKKQPTQHIGRGIAAEVTVY